MPKTTARPEAMPTATHAGQEWVTADGTRYWAKASGERFIWHNRPPGYQCPPEHPVYAVIALMYEESGRAAA
jgi:hypothetical protein